MYRNAISWAAFSIIAIATAPASAESAEVRFQPPGHTFSVSLPTPPTHQRRSTATIIGKIHTDVWGSQQAGGDFSVAVTDLPSVALWFNSDDGLLEKARSKMLETLGAQQADLRTLRGGLFRQQLDYFIPGQLGKPARRGRAWLALFDDKLVVLTALVPLSTADRRLDRHFSGVQPVALAQR